MSFNISQQIAVPDVVVACTNADILIFVLPHQFVKDTCEKMIPAVKPGALGLSLIKVSTVVILNLAFRLSKSRPVLV